MKAFQCQPEAFKRETTRLWFVFLGGPLVFVLIAQECLAVRWVYAGLTLTLK